MSNVSTVREGPILRITIDRADKKNAITAAMYAALAAAFARATPIRACARW